MAKNLARVLQAKVTMHELYREAKLTKKNPECFSDVFEANIYTPGAYDKKVVSQKWQRCIDGETLPSPNSIESYCETMLDKGIFPKYTSQYSTQKVYNSPLWKALNSEAQSSRFWKTFFKSIQPGIIRILGADVPFAGKSAITSLSISPRKVFEIYHYLNDEALACMLAFIRLHEQCQNNWKLQYQYFEFFAYVLIIEVTESPPYSEYQYELYSYIRDQIVRPDKNAFCTKMLWDKSSEELIQDSFRIYESVAPAREKGIIKSKRDKADFLFYYIQANPLVIDWELQNSDFIIPENCKLDAHGLLWLVKEMNKHRPDDEKVVLPSTSTN